MGFRKNRFILVTNNDSRSRSTIHSERFQHSCLTAPPFGTSTSTRRTPSNECCTNGCGRIPFSPLFRVSGPPKWCGPAHSPFIRGCFLCIAAGSGSLSGSWLSPSRPGWRPEPTVKGPYGPASPGFREVWVMAIRLITQRLRFILRSKYGIIRQHLGPSKRTSHPLTIFMPSRLDEEFGLLWHAWATGY